MMVEHNGKRPQVDASAWIAPNAVICGDVTIGRDTRVLYGAVITAETGPVTIGESCIIMEQAVIRGVSRQPARLGNHILVGPHAHLTGCTIENEVFIATGSCVFNGATIGATSTVRINGIVHINTVLPAGTSMPIGWIAVGDPARLFSPHDGEAVLEALRAERFSETVFGLVKPDAEASVGKTLATRYAAGLAAHRDDQPLP